jgi:hypothetical protein
MFANLRKLSHHANENLMPVHACRIYKAFQEGYGIRVDEVLWQREGKLPGRIRRLPEPRWRHGGWRRRHLQRHHGAQAHREALEPLEKRIRNHWVDFLVSRSKNPKPAGETHPPVVRPGEDQPLPPSFAA